MTNLETLKWRAQPAGRRGYDAALSGGCARGWERAVDAQARIVRAVQDALDRSGSADNAAIVSHGAVGALLLCRLRGQPISRTALAPGQGYYVVFRRPAGEVLRGWTPVEEDTGLA